MKQLDEAIVRAAQAGDHEAFAAIYERYHHYVYSICLRMRKNSPDAEDLTQEVFIHLIRFLPSFRWEAKFTTWLHRMAVSVVLWKCRPKRIQTISTEDFRHEDGSLIGIEPAVEDAYLSGTATRVTLNRYLDELPQELRQSILLKEIRGLTPTEIASIQKISAGRVKSTHTRAIAAIRKIAASATSRD